MVDSTCIKKLEPNNNYYVMIHPMPELFEQVVARFYDYQTNDHSAYAHFNPKIQSFRDQKLDNNLIIKIVKLDKDITDIHPLVSIFEAHI